MSVWLCRAGRKGEYEPAFLEENKIFYTYEEVDQSLVSIGTKSALKQFFLSAMPYVKTGSAAAWASQGYSFAYSMKIGEYVILPSKISPGIIYVGKISGDYCFDENAISSYRHFRPVEWVARIPRSHFDPDLQTSFNYPPTIYKIREDDEKRLIIAINSYSEASTPPPKIGTILTLNQVPLIL